MGPAVEELRSSVVRRPPRNLSLANVYKVCGVGAAKPRRGPPTPRSVPAIASGRKSVGGVRTTAIVVVYYTNSSHRVCEAWSGLVSEHSLFDNSLDANL
jgi:hypothetical protein